MTRRCGVPRPKPIFRISTELALELDGDVLSVKSRQFSLLYALIPVIAILTTWATGFWYRGTPSGLSEYGFPLPWKIAEIIPVCNGCSLPTSYNWRFFVINAAF